MKIFWEKIVFSPQKNEEVEEVFKRETSDVTGLGFESEVPLRLIDSWNLQKLKGQFPK